jgi:septal ring factor EnvC (AmiA/AmiB activator)
MAQDFHALFPLNDKDTLLNDSDLHGVELAAIKGLNQKVNEQDAQVNQMLEEKDSQIQTLKAQNASLAQRLNELEAAVKRLSARR